MPVVRPFLRRLLHGRDLEITDTVEMPDLTADQIQVLRINMDNVQRNDSDWAQVDRRLVDDVRDGSPISLFQIKRLLVAVQWTRVRPGIRGARELRKPGDQAAFDEFERRLKTLRQSMLAEKEARRALRAQTSEMDTAGFQRRTAILNLIATTASAIAAIASCYVAYLQYSRGG